MANNTGKKWGGRRKGTPNSDTKDLRERVRALLDDKWDKVLEDMDKLSSKDRMDSIIKLLDFALPRLSRQETVDTTSVEYFMSLSPAERMEMKKEFEKKLNKK